MLRGSHRNTGGAPGAEVGSCGSAVRSEPALWGCSPCGQSGSFVLKTYKFESNSDGVTYSPSPVRKKKRQMKLKSDCSDSLQLNEFIEGSVMWYYTWFSSHKSHINCSVKLSENSHCLTCSSYQSQTDSHLLMCSQSAHLLLLWLHTFFCWDLISTGSLKIDSQRMCNSICSVKILNKNPENLGA